VVAAIVRRGCEACHRTAAAEARPALGPGLSGRLDRLLEARAPLLSLDLSLNRIGSAGARALGEALSHPRCTVTTLSLRGNVLGDAGAAALVRPFLIQLAAAASTADDPAAAAAVGGGRCSLESIDVTNNQIGPVGAAALGRLAAALGGLRRLGLGYNSIGDRGLADLLSEAAAGVGGDGGGGGRPAIDELGAAACGLTDAACAIVADMALRSGPAGSKVLRRRLTEGWWG
jgi:hypothetical protein